MQYRKLGKTDERVSVICLGTMTFGEQNSESDAHEQLSYAISNGVNFIDTAEMYAIPPKKETQGLTESYVGSWIEKYKKRDKYILATKVAGPGMNYIRGGTRLNKKQINKAINSSLKRLKTDYIDLYQVHWPERDSNFFGELDYMPNMNLGVQIEETYDTLSKAVESGKIRYIGVSNETPWGILEYLRLHEKNNFKKIVSIQNPYSLLNRVYEIGLAEISHREHIGLLAYSPLGFGVLTGKYQSRYPKNSRLGLYGDWFTRYSTPQSKKATAKYIKIAKEFNLSPTQLALAFVNTRPFVTSNIIGATTMKQLKENIDSANVKITQEMLESINDVHKVSPNPAP